MIVNLLPPCTTTPHHATPHHNIPEPQILLMHQTALKYEMEVSDGGRLELQTPLSKGTRVVLFVVRESPDDFSDLMEASESTLGFWDNPIGNYSGT